MEEENGKDLRYNTLRDFLLGRPNRRASEDLARFLFKRIVSHVENLHEHGKIHRNLNLETIFVTANGEIKVGDYLSPFSSSSSPSASHSPPNGQQGMPGGGKEASGQQQQGNNRSYCHFHAPEMWEGKEMVSWSSDVWSLGIVLYVMVCGVYPFLGKDEAEIYFSIQRGSLHVPPFVSPSCADLIHSILNPSASLRLALSSIKLHPWVQLPSHISSTPLLFLSPSSSSSSSSAPSASSFSSIPSSTSFNNLDHISLLSDSFSSFSNSPNVSFSSSIQLNGISQGRNEGMGGMMGMGYGGAGGYYAGGNQISLGRSISYDAIPSSNREERRRSFQDVSPRSSAHSLALAPSLSSNATYSQSNLPFSSSNPPLFSKSSPKKSGKSTGQGNKSRKEEENEGMEGNENGTSQLKGEEEWMNPEHKAKRAFSGDTLVQSAIQKFIQEKSTGLSNLNNNNFFAPLVPNPSSSSPSVSPSDSISPSSSTSLSPTSDLKHKTDTHSLPSVSSSIKQEGGMKENINRNQEGNEMEVGNEGNETFNSSHTLSTPSFDDLSFSSSPSLPLSSSTSSSSVPLMTSTEHSGGMGGMNNVSNSSMTSTAITTTNMQGMSNAPSQLAATLNSTNPELRKLLEQVKFNNPQNLFNPPAGSPVMTSSGSFRLSKKLKNANKRMKMAHSTSTSSLSSSSDKSKSKPKSLSSSSSSPLPSSLSSSASTLSATSIPKSISALPKPSSNLALQHPHHQQQIQQQQGGQGGMGMGGGYSLQQQQQRQNQLMQQQQINQQQLRYLHQQQQQQMNQEGLHSRTTSTSDYSLSNDKRNTLLSSQSNLVPFDVQSSPSNLYSFSHSHLSSPPSTSSLRGIHHQQQQQQIGGMGRQGGGMEGGYGMQQSLDSIYSSHLHSDYSMKPQEGMFSDGSIHGFGFDTNFNGEKGYTAMLESEFADLDSQLIQDQPFEAI